MVPSMQQLVEAFGEMVRDRQLIGFESTFLTFMFNPIGGGPRRRKAVMERELERIYHLQLTHIVRRPEKRDKAFGWPLWIGMPDLPVFKHDKISMRDASVNDGLHYHVVALIPLFSRLKSSFVDFIDDEQARFAGRDKLLFRLHAEPIEYDPEYVVGYGSKSVLRGRFEIDDILILPRASSERTRLSKTARAYEREQARQHRIRR